MNYLGLALSFVAGVRPGAHCSSLSRRVADADQQLAVAEDLAAALHHRIRTDDGGVVHVLEEGPVDAPPIVLLHGVTLDNSIWHRQFLLAGDHRVLSVSLRGHGQSTVGADGVSIETCAGDLARVLQHFDLRGATVVGHSMGGMVLSRFLVDRPVLAGNRIGAVGFLASAPRRPTRVPTGVLAMASGQLAKLVGPFGPRGLTDPQSSPPSELGEMSVRATFGRPARPDDVREVARAFEAMDVSSFLEMAPSLLNHDLVIELEDNPIPASVIVGARDPITPVDESRLLADLFADCEMTVLPEAGHQLMLERPNEITDWVRELVQRARAPRRTPQR